MRLWISVKGVGMKLDKSGGVIGRRNGSGKSDLEKIWNECI